MASAQLSSLRRAGAGSDLKETAPSAPGALLRERRAGHGGQDHGGARAADPQHRLRSLAGRSDLPGPSLPAQPPSAQAATCARSSACAHYPPAEGRLFIARSGGTAPSHLRSPGSPTAVRCKAWNEGAGLLLASEPPPPRNFGSGGVLGCEAHCQANASPAPKTPCVPLLVGGCQVGVSQMASAQLSSLRRAGAGSDLKETAPSAPGALLRERRAGHGGQDHGGARAADPQHRLRSLAGRSDLPGPSLPAQPPSAQAATCARSSACAHYPPAEGRLFIARSGGTAPSHLRSPGSPTAVRCKAWNEGAGLLLASEPPPPRNFGSGGVLGCEAHCQANASPAPKTPCVPLLARGRAQGAR
ncbi:PREDICTED: double homeobox protein 4-like protein 4 [Galeopterus variegatus]|uniref:Double homeobox protein 4-like protein 4 n=1 Tax=Galeopterus variegatus TaxID=482537 RepID=A0ABM0RX01_GALVR|nr:PREDICTED: double homeobox protein 4-like protein 4 [Galeopterus variegatus]